MSTMNACNVSDGKKCCPCVGVGMAIGFLSLGVGVMITLYVFFGPGRLLWDSRTTPLDPEFAQTISDSVTYAWWGGGLSLGGTLLMGILWLMKWRKKKSISP
jgi:hypothetical protein